MKQLKWLNSNLDNWKRDQNLVESLVFSYDVKSKAINRMKRVRWISIVKILGFSFFMGSIGYLMLYCVACP